MSSEKEVQIWTKSVLIEQLKACKITLGDIVEVHASLKSIGYIAGGPQTLIDAIMDVIGLEGTIVMAAQAHDNSEPAFFEHPPIEVKDFDNFRLERPVNRGKLENFRHMGELAKALMMRPNSYISSHPQMAFVALGKYAKWITQNHPLNAELGIDSPLGKCLELKSKVCLIGVEYDNATGLHLGEHMSGLRSHILQGARLLVRGESQWVQFNAINYDSDDFIEVGKRLEAKHRVNLGRLGQAFVKVFMLEEGVLEAKAYFEDMK